MNPLPVIVTVLPPVVDPAVGLMPVTDGGTYVNSLAQEATLVPAEVVTRTQETLPGAGGETAVQIVEDEHDTWVAGTELARFGPKATVVEPEPPGVTNPVPVIVTVVPPDEGPAVGLTPVTVGALCADAAGTAVSHTPGSARTDAVPIKTTARKRPNVEANERVFCWVRAAT